MVFTFANGALGTFLLSDAARRPALGADLAGEHQLRRRTPTRTATTSPGPRDRCRCRRMRLKIFPGERSWWEPFDDVDGRTRAQRPAGQPGRALRGRHPRRGRADLQRPGRPEDAARGGRRVESARTGRPVDLLRETAGPPAGGRDGRGGGRGRAGAPRPAHAHVRPSTACRRDPAHCPANSAVSALAQVIRCAGGPPCQPQQERLVHRAIATAPWALLNAEVAGGERGEALLQLPLVDGQFRAGAQHAALARSRMLVVD